MREEYATACVLSYNRPAFLAQCLTTMAVNADYPLEIIVHDDGSSDEQVIDYLQRQVAGSLVSSVIFNPPGHNQGQGVALNRMFNMASGDPVIKCDQDLIFGEGWLKTAVGIFEADDDDVPDEDYDGDLGLLGLMHYAHEPVDSRKTILSERPGYSVHTHILGSAFAMRRECMEDVGPFEEHSEAFAEDNDMQLRVARHPDWVCGLPPDDLVQNVGFGVGPSTVVVDHGVVADIHKGPRIFVPDRMGLWKAATS